MNPIHCNRWPLPLLLAGLLLLSGTAGAVTLSWVGCGITKKAFMAELAEAYRKETGTEITIEGGGATKGIRKVAAIGADLGGSCRYRLENNEKEEGVVFNPVAWDALVVITHPGNPVESISMEQIKRLYRGEINNWKELGGEDRPLKLFARKGKISGVGLSIRQLVFGDLDMSFAADRFYPSSGPLEKAVEKDPAAIAITGISSARKRKVKILSLEGRRPSYENIKSGNYLLYRPLYLVTRPQGEHADEIARFLAFSHSRKGREIIRANGVVPYLEAVRLSFKQREQWQAVRPDR
ncbi:MAG TPA: phosphate ABC transporter substrate-binding protein [Sedimenticola thiotaurini]|uniref:Phosphate ABC transporter substrate-binding protein n=1 Tax=Sedimenticola thiotaurini TaxID=1543721 RepID=A0A831RMB6_9GAMM|nr:phosphate ABC transporter substrate-binding protein [Sedimenticola thiotaurini]